MMFTVSFLSFPSPTPVDITQCCKPKRVIVVVVAGTEHDKIVVISHYASFSIHSVECDENMG